MATTKAPAKKSAVTKKKVVAKAITKAVVTKKSVKVPAKKKSILHRIFRSQKGLVKQKALNKVQIGITAAILGAIGIVAVVASHGATRADLIAPVASAYGCADSKTIGSGASTPCVKYAQAMLNFNGAAIAVDGVFGPATKAAAVEYQKENHLSPDGIIGPKSWASLIADTAARKAAEDARVAAAVKVAAAQAAAKAAAVEADRIAQAKAIADAAQVKAAADAARAKAAADAATKAEAEMPPPNSAPAPDPTAENSSKPAETPLPAATATPIRPDTKSKTTQDAVAAHNAAVAAQLARHNAAVAAQAAAHKAAVAAEATAHNAAVTAEAAAVAARKAQAARDADAQAKAAKIKSDKVTAQALKATCKTGIINILNNINCKPATLKAQVLAPALPTSVNSCPAGSHPAAGECQQNTNSAASASNLNSTVNLAPKSACPAGTHPVAGECQQNPTVITAAKDTQAHSDAVIIRQAAEAKARAAQDAKVAEKAAQAHEAAVIAQKIAEAKVKTAAIARVSASAKLAQQTAADIANANKSMAADAKHAAAAKAAKDHEDAVFARQAAKLALQAAEKAKKDALELSAQDEKQELISAKRAASSAKINLSLADKNAHSILSDLEKISKSSGKELSSAQEKQQILAAQQAADAANKRLADAKEVAAKRKAAVVAAAKKIADSKRLASQKKAEDRIARDQGYVDQADKLMQLNSIVFLPTDSAGNILTSKGCGKGYNGISSNECQSNDKVFTKCKSGYHYSGLDCKKNSFIYRVFGI